MIKYYLIYPIIYKILSSNSLTRKTYRSFANCLGDRRRRKRGLPFNNVEQGRMLVSLMEKHCDMLNEPHILELGTGWIHFYSTFIRLFFNIKLTLFDITDNRQILAFKHFFTQLESYLTIEEKKRLQDNVVLYEKIKSIESFDTLYDLINANYVLDSSGNLTSFPDNSFHIVFSCVVLEHIDKKIVDNFVKDIRRILKPGGYSIHIIDMGDHYHFMDKKNTHKKEYLRFSNKTWKFYFQNKIHYINRLQESDWTLLFEKNDFDLLYKNPLTVDIGGIQPSKDFYKYSKATLECHKVLLLHRKRPE